MSGLILKDLIGRKVLEAIMSPETFNQLAEGDLIINHRESHFIFDDFNDTTVTYREARVHELAISETGVTLP